MSLRGMEIFTDDIGVIGQCPQLCLCHISSAGHGRQSHGAECDQRMRRHVLFNLIKINELEVSDVHTKQSEPENVVDAILNGTIITCEKY
jgi:hypothetical protein